MDIRQQFLDFFQSKGHQLISSSALVPDDATLMFTNAGMVQFKNIFIGDESIPNPPRATSSQPCLRAGGKHNDLDNVGYTARHHTFFEMLGNFSFANYFKEDAIAYAWEFITDAKYLNLPIDKIWVTIHDSDNEAEEFWAQHISRDRIIRFGDADNFWQMGETGPCGPCSEIFYDQGEDNFNLPEDKIGGEGDRFLEIWNLVFMQYDRDSKGKLTLLPKPSIDTGMGLERVVAIKEGVQNNYHSTLFMPFLNKIGEIVGTPYNFISDNSASYRVIADHLRSCSFLLAQGVNFDKEGRGYVLRRIMRRAIRHGYLLGLRKPFMYKLVDTLVEVMSGQYEYLSSKSESIKTSMKLEEERFFDTIDAGIKLFSEELKNTKDVFNGTVAFKLYDTYGFPLDLTQDMLREKNIQLNIDTFNNKMQFQKAQSKANWKGTGDISTIGDFKSLKEEFGINKFVGYETKETKSTILSILDNNFKRVDRLNGKGWVLLDRTPFYAESGGQVGDIGKLLHSNIEIDILDTQKFINLNLSQFKGVLEIGDRVIAKVDRNRLEIEKHHSATHLLHAGLREILGEHISQAGSLNNDKKLRFDFSHPKAITDKEILTIEAWVNDKINRAIPSITKIMSIDEAKNSGAMSLCGKKYGNSVRVVSINHTSVELCGGTHITNTAQIGLFMITKESGVSAGVRRVEAICGDSAIEAVRNLRDELNNIKSELKNQNAIAGIHKLKDDIKTLKSDLKTSLSLTKKDLATIMIGDIIVIIDEVEAGDIKEFIDESKNQYQKILIMLFQKKGDKVMIACGSKETSIKAGDWIKQIAPILSGGGGGRPDFAQAGGKDASKIDDAKIQSLKYIEDNLSLGEIE
ncbi:MAG: alanine--tRNA ligase [Sulfurovum sp.]|nr:alanine--tRNA ligase [Sulfurovaceae bacterium]